MQKKESCIIFEDSLSGVKNAVEAGFKNIIVLHNNDYNNDFNSFPEVKYHSSTFIDIIDFIKENY